MADYTREQVSEALNSACDDILAATGLEEGRAVDALNMLVNAALSYLTGEAKTLAEVAERNYGEDPEAVLGWLRDG